MTTLLISHVASDVGRRMFAVWALVLGGFLAGCATKPAIDGQAAVLSLSYDRFDQTKGSGWRPLYDEQRECGTAGALIEAYLQRHKELTPDQKAILHFHAAQMFAYDGDNARAVSHLDRARSPAKDSGLGLGWDDTVAATRAFLLRDRASLLAAKERLRASHESSEEVDELIEHFGESYADMRWWAALSPVVTVPKGASKEHHATAEKLAKAFGIPMSEAAASSPHSIWVELRRQGSDSDWDGYLVFHYSSGTVISASGEEWLNAAVERFISSSRERNGRREAPTGLITSFRLAR